MHHSAPPLGVRHQELLEGEHAAHDVLRGFHPVDSGATIRRSPHLGPQPHAAAAVDRVGVALRGQECSGRGPERGREGHGGRSLGGGPRSRHGNPFSQAEQWKPQAP